MTDIIVTAVIVLIAVIVGYSMGVARINKENSSRRRHE